MREFGRLAWPGSRGKDVGRLPVGHLLPAERVGDLLGRADRRGIASKGYGRTGGPIPFIGWTTLLPGLS